MRVILRAAVMADNFLLYGWQSAPDVARWARNPTAPKRTDVAAHQAWLADHIGHVFIIELESVPVGMLALDDGCEITIVVDPAYRRMGVAVDAIRKIMRRRAGLIAQVKDDNVPSHRLFQRLGWRVCGGTTTGYTDYGSKRF